MELLVALSSCPFIVGESAAPHLSHFAQQSIPEMRMSEVLLTLIITFKLQETRVADQGNDLGSPALCTGWKPTMSTLGL